MSQKPLSFDLFEIADWQLNIEAAKVELPALQRSFVWKPSQVESLWDSLLRGFPIGAFLLSKSEDDQSFLMDGQQRATSIALGLYNPWQNKDARFWSVSRIPTVWVDLAPQQLTEQHRFVIRVLTPSHPWGYQRVNHNDPLSVSDKRKALELLKETAGDGFESYLKVPATERFPYDANLPVPLIFLLKAIFEHSTTWKSALADLCAIYLPVSIKTKHADTSSLAYADHLRCILMQETDHLTELYAAVKNLTKIAIPGILISQANLKVADNPSGEDPTLFVRLNAAGTRLVGEELIYSIYKASFPQAKDLVEGIGASFIAPSQVISMATRLVLSDINDGRYPPPLNVNDFIKRLSGVEFQVGIKLIIGDRGNSPAEELFQWCFNLMLSEGNLNLPPVLVKKIIKDSPDLFLMLLQWRKHNIGEMPEEGPHAIVAALTALSWFGRNNVKYVRESWADIKRSNFWSREFLRSAFIQNREAIMYPLLKPETLRFYLLQKINENNARHDGLMPSPEEPISKFYQQIFNQETFENEGDQLNAAGTVWNNFIGKLSFCRPMLLFAQRGYINFRFSDFNQMETIEDTNSPWDWDHIYPSSWVYMQHRIDGSMRHWNNTIGNLRVLSLEENRSEGNNHSPASRLNGLEKESFIQLNDLEFWKLLEGRVYEDEKDMIHCYLKAVINRLCNIYEMWYDTLKVGELFDYE